MKYLDEHIKWLRDNANGVRYKDLAVMFNEKFNTKCSGDAIQQICTKHKISNNVKFGRFEKGIVPHNKGKKMSKETKEKLLPTLWKKGHRPKKARNVGSERIDKDGYIIIKVAEPNKWKRKHVWIWEQANGEKPKGYKIMFADQNKRNFSLDNLVLISDAENAVMCKKKMYSTNAESTKAGLKIVKLMRKVKELRENITGTNGNGSRQREKSKWV